MKKIVFYSLLFLSTSVLFSQNPCVKYDGIYVFKINKDNSALLRFYESGEVIASTSENDYKTITSWFNKENDQMVLKGTYKFKNCKSTFSVKGYSGEQKHTITASPESIEVEIKDKESKKTTQRTYTFISS